MPTFNLKGLRFTFFLKAEGINSKIPGENNLIPKLI